MEVEPLISQTQPWWLTELGWRTLEAQSHKQKAGVDHGRFAAFCHNEGDPLPHEGRSAFTAAFLIPSISSIVSGCRLSLRRTRPDGSQDGAGGFLDYGEKHQCRALWRPPALLPVPNRADADPECRRKLRLRQPKSLSRGHHVDIACSDPVNVATCLLASREGDRIFEPLCNCLKCLPAHVSPLEMPCQFANQRGKAVPVRLGQIVLLVLRKWCQQENWYDITVKVVDDTDATGLAPFASPSGRLGGLLSFHIGEVA